MPFRDVVGHNTRLRLLSGPWLEGRCHQACCFRGRVVWASDSWRPRWAQVLNCAASATSAAIDACGSCSSCRRIERGSHPDVVLVEPGDNGSIGVEPIRQLTGRSAYKPFEGRCRVVIVDNADRLMWSAQNALLKTLEEPRALRSSCW